LVGLSVDDVELELSALELELALALELSLELDVWLALESGLLEAMADSEDDGDREDEEGSDEEEIDWGKNPRAGLALDELSLDELALVLTSADDEDVLTSAETSAGDEDDDDDDADGDEDEADVLEAAVEVDKVVAANRGFRV
jgi:hypothetical protein